MLIPLAIVCKSGTICLMKWHLPSHWQFFVMQLLKAFLFPVSYDHILTSSFNSYFHSYFRPIRTVVFVIVLYIYATLKILIDWFLKLTMQTQSWLLWCTRLKTMLTSLVSIINLHARFLSEPVTFQQFFLLILTVFVWFLEPGTWFRPHDSSRIEM